MMVSYVIFALVFVAVMSNVHTIDVKPCGKLPVPIFQTAAVLNENSDSIYILGGYDGKYNIPDILKYNLISQSVEVVGEFSNDVAAGATATDKNGNIYYFGGGPKPIDGYSPNFIHKFSTRDSKVSTLGSLSTHFWPGGNSAVNIDDYIYILGGDYGYLNQKYVFKYHIPTNTFGVIQELPVNVSTTTVVYNGKHIYAFGGYVNNVASDVVLKFDPVTLKIEVLDTVLPETKTGANSHLVGDVAYIFGGRNADFKLSKNVALFNTITESITETIVNSPFPLPRSAGAVYVEKENILYMFGGSGESGISDDILCIDLNN